MSNTYVDIMIQSLEKKIQVLDRIILLDKIQKEQLEDEGLTTEDFDNVVEEKSELIEQLNQLDSGFEKLFQRVKEELDVNREQYKEQIRKMQEMIRSITDKSVEIQAQEARNKELMMNKFTRIKQRSKVAHTNYRAASQYYKNMMQSNVVDPQFMDKTK